MDDMTGTRPRALVTAPVSGPGLDLLRELADLVIDPWIDQRPLRMYNAEQLAERARAEGATILVVEADSCKGPVFELPLVAICSAGATPTTSTWPPPPPPACPCWGGPQRRRRRRAHRGAAAGGDPRGRRRRP